MSTIYKINDIVPTNVLANRLNQLSDAVCKGPDEVRRQFDMRIPAERDRDADLVLSQSARRMTELEVKLAKVTAERASLLNQIELIHEVWKKNREADQYLLTECCKEIADLRKQANDLSE